MGFRFPVSGFRFPVSSFRFPDSGFWFPVSGFLFPDSSFQFPVSNFAISNFQDLCPPSPSADVKPRATLHHKQHGDKLPARAWGRAPELTLTRSGQLQPATHPPISVFPTYFQFPTLSTLNFQCPTLVSGFHFPLSTFQFPVSNFHFPISFF